MTGDYMEYTFKPATYRNLQITIDTFEQDATYLGLLHFVDMSYSLLLTCLRGLAPGRASFTKHPLAPHLMQDICPRRALLQ